MAAPVSRWLAGDQRPIVLTRSWPSNPTDIKPFTSYCQSRPVERKVTTYVIQSALEETSVPLRDHFRPPVSKKSSWEGFHGMWPASIVRQLRKVLPQGYVAEPRVHLGTLMEIDVLVDLATIRRFNLYAQLMQFIGHPDRGMSIDEPSIYATSCRGPTRGTRARLEAWSYALVVGQALPTLPLWLSDDQVMPLNLEQSYEQACDDLWIT
jgi:hypothetical protein